MTALVELAIADGVAHLHFNRAERMNALDQAMAEAFGAAIMAALAAPETRVLLMTGAGRSFMAGGDLQSFATATDKPGCVGATIDPIHDALKALADSDVITIAAVHGAVAGAGVSILALADLAIAAEGTSLTMAYTRISGVPDCGGSWALPRVVGLKQAMAMALLNAPLEAQAALSLGLLNRIVPIDALLTEALALAARIAKGAGMAQGYTARLLRQSFGTGLHDQLDAERAAFVACAGTPDFTEGITAFLERRNPQFNR